MSSQQTRREEQTGVERNLEWIATGVGGNKPEPKAKKLTEETTEWSGKKLTRVDCNRSGRQPRGDVNNESEPRGTHVTVSKPKMPARDPKKKVLEP